jgi:hypothetical protein
MYVNAPSRSTNGSTFVQETCPCTYKDGFPGPRYQSVSEALSHAHDYNYSFPAGVSETTRTQMQGGRVGRGQFEVTPYGAIYMKYASTSPITLVTKSRTGGDHTVELHHPRINGSGGFNTGVGVHQLDIHPGGGHWQALYNKAVIANLQARCLAEAKNKLNKNEISLAGSLAGLDKTILMVAERTAQAVLAVRQVRRGNYKAAAKTLGLTRTNIKASTPAKAWLEIQYGWRPLLTDIYNGMDQANTMLRQEGGHFGVTRRLETGLLTRPPEPDLGPDGFSEIESSHYGKASVEIKFKARVDNPTLAYLNSLQVVNPLSFLWENLPFSFVTDWLVPVGDWLNSITAPLGLTFVSGYRTTRIWGDWVFSAKNKGGQAPLLNEVVTVTGTASAALRLAIMDRHRYDAWPTSTPYLRLPSTSSERVANALALLATTIRPR